MDLVDRCLAAARQCARDPQAVAKADYPTRDDFDDAIAKLADAIWLDGEPYHRAYARALDSADGQILFWARDRAAIPELVHKAAEPVKLSKAEQAIATATEAYMKSHPDLSYEKSLTAVLDADPELYGEYLRERE